MVTLRGIPDCDNVRRASSWLAARGLSWGQRLNRQGQWRRLPPEEVRSNLDQAGATGLMLAGPDPIRWPLLDTGTRPALGFSTGRYPELLG